MSCLTPTLVTAPVTNPVHMVEVRDYLRVVGSAQDMTIGILVAAAVGYLDGWRGILGRAIMPQTWRVTVEEAGTYVLPMPDVTSASMDGTALEVLPSATGPVVVVAGGGDIEFICAMDRAQLDIAKAAILFLVEHWFWNRGAITSGPAIVVPIALDTLISSIRWRLL